MKWKVVVNRFPLSVDQLIALAILPFILLVLGALYLLVVPLQGRPFLFAAERMRGPFQSFIQLKIRTMQPVDRISEQSAMGGDLSHRITRIGAFMRKTRLDELPQIFNVLRGEMVFIGPRPALKKYVEGNPAYARSLSKGPPGITGLATVLLHAREERILSKCLTAAETDRVYRAHCIPLKIRIDELYQRKKCIRLKIFILWRTLSSLRMPDVLPGPISSTNEKSILSRMETNLFQPSRNARLK